MTTLETFDGAPLAVVLLGASGTIERATDAFMDRYGSDDTLASHQAQIERVIAGGLNHATVKLDDASAEMFAVVSSDGQRHALLTISLQGNGHSGDRGPVALLEGPIEGSPAIVWLKDLDGRYLRVNRRYTEELQTDAEDICGHTDADLPTTKSIEGWRLRADDLVPQEPLELEYTVPAFDDRPAYSVLRFALRDSGGQPLAVCGIAAPLSQAQVARSECERLMRVERWSRLDERAIRKELLDDWGLAPAGAPRQAPDGAPSAPGAGAASGGDALRLVAERDAALAASESLNQQLAEERTQLEALQTASSEATERAEELLGTLTAEQSRSAELEQLLVLAQARLQEIGSEHAKARSSAEQAETEIAEALASERQTIERLRAELDAAREQLKQLHEAEAAGPSPEQIEAERARAEQAALAAQQAQAQAAATAEALESERRTVEELRAGLDAARSEAEQAQHAAAEIASQAPKVEELDGERARADQAEASLAQERERAGQVEASLAQEHERAQQAEALVAQERARAEQAEASLAHERTRAEHTEAALEQERAEGQQRWTGTESELAEARAELTRARDEAGASAAELAAERQTAENLRAELARVHEELERAQRELAEAPSRQELDEQRARAERAEAALEQASSATDQNATALAAEQETTQLLRVELRAARQEVRRARETAGAAATAGETTRQERARAEQAEAALEQERARAEQAEAALEHVRARAEQSEAALEQERARAGAAEAALEEEQRYAEELRVADEQRAESESAAVEQLKDELAQALAAAEQAQSEAVAAAAELADREQSLRTLREELSAHTEVHHPSPRVEEPVTAGRAWNASSQRALSAALIGAREWRTSLKQVVKALGEEGGWDAAVAWCPDQWRGWMRCVGVWTGQAPEVTPFETMTWQHRPEMTGTEFGRARNRPGPTNLLELRSAEDNLLRAAAAEGMTSALLVPIQNAVMIGPDMLAMIGLFGHSEVPADPELILSLEAIALQLSTIGHLLETAASPHWGMGRL
jgi:PAS domain-containing protein